MVVAIPATPIKYSRAVDAISKGTRKSMSVWIKIAAAILAVACLVLGFRSWQANRRDMDQLKSALAAADQALATAISRQQDRDAQLQKTLSALNATKRRAATATPAQIVQDLPNVISLPKLITLQPADIRSPAAGIASSSQATESSQANLPIEDLKPLHDFALDCQACQARLAAAQGDLQDERVKTQVLTKAKDEAVRATKGGGTWKRVARAAKWFGLGAAAGLIAAKATH
jgi:hypothetical protein